MACFVSYFQPLAVVVIWKKKKMTSTGPKGVALLGGLALFD